MSPDPQLSFGMGCLAFRYDRDPPFDLTWEEYLDAINKALTAIPNIEDVHISYFRELWSSIHVDEVPNPMSDHGALFPFTQQTGLTVRFNIHIPKRLHSDLIPLGPASTCEDFQVLSTVEYHGPATLVVEKTMTDRPNRGVVLVREFLERELNRSDAPIRLDWVGPSPFHSDCRLEAVPSIGPQIQAQVVPRTGYQERIFTYDPLEVPSIETAFEELRLDLMAELSLYYLIERSNNIAFHEWSDLEEQSGGLVSLLQAGGASGLWNRMVKTPKAISGLSVSVAQFEAQAIFNDASLASACQEFYDGDSLYSLQEEIERARTSRPPTPTSQITRIIDLADAGRTRRVQAASLSLAAVLGGAVGALITIGLH